jgi:hypothetical protein
MVAYEFISKRVIRLWQDDFGPQPPFSTDDSTLFITYMASAEWGCFLSLGWKLPSRILDLYCEFGTRPTGSYCREADQTKRISAWPITTSLRSPRRRRMLCGRWYCGAALGHRRSVSEYSIIASLTLTALSRYSSACCRGSSTAAMGSRKPYSGARFTTAAARMERIGTPIDVETLEQFRTYWPDIKLG